MENKEPIVNDDLFSRLDPDQAAAVRLRRNGTVSAGAGSGKTTVLAARYLDLVLSSGADLPSVLCLTFTRKAAAEMRSRVWSVLSRHPSARAREQAARFSEAMISTIDSFCGTLLRSSAQLYGFPPDFLVDDEGAAELAEREALRFLLERREEPAIADLLAMMGFETAWTELFAKAGQRFATPAPRADEDLRAVPARAREALRRIARDAASSLDEARGRALALGASSSKNGREALALLAALPADLLSILELKDDAGNPQPGLEGIARLAEAASSLCSLQLRFGRSEEELLLKEAVSAAREASRRLASAAGSASLRPVEDAALGALADFAELLLAEKRRAGIMGFRDVEAAAVDLLTREGAVRAWWKGRFRYIMVDEFQDDDELQKELLFLLAESPGLSSPGLPRPEDLAPDKLFFVGDDKQSIYRFRGADVSVFNRLGRELEAGLGGAAEETLPRLRTNYRSEPGLIAFLNSLFARLLAAPLGASVGEPAVAEAAGQPGTPVADYEARFEEALARAPTAGLVPTVTLLWKPRREKGTGQDLRSADEALAEGTVRRLKALIEGGCLLVPAGQGASRKATWDDVAILFRSTSKQYLMERFLRVHDVPYTAASLRGLFVEAPANDLFAALRLALMPGDRPSWASFLRSPFVGLGAEAFVLVLATERTALGDYGDLDLPAEESLRLGAGQTLLRGLAERADRIPLAELVSWLWFEEGQRLSLLAEPDSHPFLEHFDFLFALAADADRRGENLASFLERTAPLVGKPEKLDEDIAVPREAARGARLMTIHKSKGLEFPIVVIPWIENSGRKDGAGRAWYLSEEAGLTLNLKAWDDPGAKRRNLFYEDAKSLDEARDLAETKRLFYVACTRASAHLVFAGIEPGRSVAPTSFLSFLGGLPAEGREADSSGAGAGGAGCELRVETVPELEEATWLSLSRRAGGRDPSSMAGFYREAEPIERRRPPDLLSAAALSELAWKEDQRNSGRGPSLPASVYDDYAETVPETAFGDLCHAALEAALRGGRLDSKHPLLATLPSALAPALHAEALRLAEIFLDSPLGRLVAGARRLEVEKALLLSLGGGKLILRCRLDLLVDTGDGLLVLDWKSGRERRPEAYEVQLDLYRRAASCLAEGRPVRSLLVWLRSGEADEVSVSRGEDELLALAERCGRLDLPAAGGIVRA